MIHTSLTRPFTSTKDWESVFAANPTNTSIGADPSALSRSALSYLKTFTSDVSNCVALDLGCGEGRDTIYLASAGLKVVARDLSPTGIEKTRQRLVLGGIKESRVDLAVVDVLNFDYPADAYDLAMAANIYQFLPDEMANEHIELLKRTVKPGGILAIGVFSPAMAAWGTDISPYFTETADGLLAHFPGARPDLNTDAGDWLLCDKTEYWTLRTSDSAHGSFAFIVVRRLT
jgi:SAM-dependent methyltransferase